MTLHHEPKLHLSTSRPSRGMSAWASPVVSLGPWISPVGASEPTKMNKDGCTAKHFMEIWLISSCMILYVTVCIMYWYDIQVLWCGQELGLPTRYMSCLWENDFPNQGNYWVLFFLEDPILVWLVDSIGEPCAFLRGYCFGRLGWYKAYNSRPFTQNLDDCVGYDNWSNLSSMSICCHQLELWSTHDSRSRNHPLPELVFRKIYRKDFFLD